jgi:hypothetical protein
VAKGQVSNERIHRTDPQTGVEILQLTSFPTPSMPFTYQRQNFTPDSKTFIFRSQRMPARDAPWDLFRVDTDGSNMVQLTESENFGTAALSPDGKLAYLMRGVSLWRVNMNTCAEEEVCRMDSLQPREVSDLVITPDGKCLYSPQSLKDGTTVLARFNADGSDADVICRGLQCAMLAYDLNGSGLLVAGDYVGENMLMLVKPDGSVEPFTPNCYAHSGWLGRKRMVQGCARWPKQALLTAGKGDAAPKVIAEGPYFWHSAATNDGEWIIADTNWPDEGLQLVHVASGRYKTLCFAGASEGHPQWTHPHPGWSPDGELAYFSSDRTGICQLHLVKVPPEFKGELSSGA